VEVFPSSRFSLDAQMGQAQCYTSLGQQAMAIDVCRAMVYRYPQSQLASQMRIHMGDLYAQLGDFRKAREAYEKVIERGDDIPADLHFKMAEVLRASGDVDEASEQYRCYLETDAEGEYANQAHYGLATVQEEQGRLAEAARDYQTLIEQYPASPLIPQATARLGIVQYELGQYEQARMTCQEALDLEVDEPLSIELEAKNVMASFRLGDVVTAETKARAFRKSHHQEKDLLAQFDIEKGSHYVSARNHKDARVAYENLITENPRSPYVDDAQYGIGMSYLGSEEYEKAIEAFRTLIQEHPQSDFIPSVYLKLGSIYYLQLHFEEAIFAYRKVVEAPGAGELVPLALFNLIQTFEATNRQDQALAVAEELLLRYPDFEDALRVKIKVGYLNMELGNYDQAVAILEEVLPLVGAEEETEVRYWIGESNYESGKYELALLEYLRVAYLSQTGSMWAVTAEFRAGQTYEALGKVDEAKRLYHQMIERYGSDSQWGQAARERLRGLEG